MLLNGGGEPKERGLARTVWLFEKEVLEQYLKTDLKDHHAVLRFDVFAMEYVINPKFNNGRADAIYLCQEANKLIKIWFIAFQTCTGEHLKRERTSS